MEEKFQVGQKGAGETIRYYRRKLGLTLDDLALKTGLSASHLWKIENNATSPRQKTLLKIQEAFEELGVDVSDGIVEDYEPVVIISSLTQAQKQVILKLIDMFDKKEIPVEFIYNILSAVEEYGK